MVMISLAIAAWTRNPSWARTPAPPAMTNATSTAASPKSKIQLRTLNAPLHTPAVRPLGASSAPRNLRQNGTAEEGEKEG